MLAMRRNRSEKKRSSKAPRTRWVMQPFSRWSGANYFTSLNLEPLEDRRLLATIDFSNSASISIPATLNGQATPYPSTITVGNLPTSGVTGVTATLNSVSAGDIDDVAVLAAGPVATNNVALMNGVGTGSVASETYTFQDGSPAMPVVGDPGSGTFSPTQVTSPTYPSPAPGTPNGTTMSVFNGQNPNGTWNLYAFNEYGDATASIAGGWSLAITVTPSTFSYSASSNPTITDYTLKLDGTGTILEVVQTSNQSNILASQYLAATSSISITGQAGVADTLRVDFSSFAGSNFPSGGLSFDGGAGSGPNELFVSNGSFMTETSTPTGAHAGGLAYSGGTTGTASITYSNLAPITDTSTVTNFTIDGTAAADTINIVNGPLVGPTQTTEVNSGVTPTFELVDFANKTNVTVDGLAGGNTITTDYTTAAAGLSTLLVDAGTAADEVDVQAIPAVPLSVNGQGGNDVINISSNAPTDTGNLAGLGATVTVDGGAGSNTLNVSESGSSSADTVLLTNDAISSAVVPFTIDYSATGGSFGGGINLSTGSAADTVNVQSTLTGGTTTVDTNGGGDTINVSSNAPTNTGNLTGLAGTLTIDGGAGSNTLNVSESGSSSADTVLLTNDAISSAVVPFTINYSASGGTFAGGINLSTGSAGDTVNVQSTLTGGTTTVDTNGGGDTINVSSDAPTDDGNLDAVAGPLSVDGGTGSNSLVVSDYGGSTANSNVILTSSQIENFAGAADNVTIGYANFSGVTLDGSNNSAIPELFQVQSTLGGGTTTTINADAGNDTITVQANALGAGGSNVFDGDAGNDTFNVNFAAGTSIPGTTSLAIDGGAAVTRDVVNLNANQSADGARTVGLAYQSAASGNLNVTGLGTSSAIQLTTVEQVNYAGDSANDDTLTVTGVNSSDSAISVTPLTANSANVFLNGSPLLIYGVSSSNNPGVAGGGAGPDINISGIDQTGFTVAGGTPSGAAGNQLIVNGTTENLNGVATTSAWGGNAFGSGSDVRANGDAFDTINVSDSAVTINNNAVGPLLETKITTATFGRANPAQAVLTVNAGDEAAANLPVSGIADNITATLSSAFFLQINGGDPIPATAPRGDMLTVATTGDIDVYSDAANPPNVTVTSSGSPGIGFNSIENVVFAPSTGVVNIWGDDNDPTSSYTQDDYYKIVGTGFEAFTLQIGTRPTHFAAPNLSAPMTFTGVTRINAYGGSQSDFPSDTNTGIDTLDVTPYANNTPQGWGIQTFWDEGDPVADGDLMIYNGVSGVSENIVVQPSGSQSGQIYSTNSATGTSVAVINYTLNTNIIVNGNDGTAGDTDTLTLDGTSPANPGSSGSDAFVADFTAAGTPGNEFVKVTDINGGAPLYNLQSMTNINTITFDTLGGADTASIIGRNDGSLKINVDGGDPGTNALALTVLGVAGSPDVFSVTPGPTNDSGSVLVTRSGAAAPTKINYSRTKSVTFDGGGGVGVDSLTVNGGGGNDVFTVIQPTSVPTPGQVQLDSNAVIGYQNFGSGASTVNLVGNGGNDTAIVDGTAAADTVTITPTAADAGSVAIASLPTVDVSTTESLVYNGEGGNDLVTVAVPTASTTTYSPGATPDSASLQVNSLVPISFTDLGVAGTPQPVTISASAGAGSTLVYQGTENNDTFAVSAVAGPLGQIVLNNQLPVQTSANVTTLTLNGLDGDDTMTVTGSTAPALPYTNINLNGGDPSASDTADLIGSGAAIIYDTGTDTQTVSGGGLGTLANPLTLTGVEVVNLTDSTASGTITVDGTAGPNEYDVTPTGTNTATLTVSGVNQTLNTTNTAALTINDGTAGDGDTLTVNGTSVSDTIDVARGATTTVAVNSLKTISLTSADVESLVVSAGTGDDTIDVTGSGGPASLTVDGGLPTASDTLAVTTTTATVTYGTDPSSGTLTTTGGPISFVGIEIISLTGDTTGTLTVNGTNGNDAINQSGNTITVNNGAVVDFTAYPTLTLNGLSGDDQFNVAPLTLTGVTTYNVAGDDPTDGDSLIVNGSAGTNAVTITPSAVDAGSVAIGGAPTVSFTTTESVEYNGLGGDDTVTVDTPAGSTTTYTPGATPDSASLQVGSLVPISFTNLGVAGTPQPVTITASAGAGSTLVYQGTENNDTFAVSAVAGPLGQIVLNNQLPVQTNANVTTLTLNGLDGDDAMTVTGSTAPALPYTAINLNGGDPSASDTVTLTGDGAAVTYNTGTDTQTVTGGGLGTVTLTGDEVVNLTDSTASGTITVDGTAGPNEYDVTPTGTNTATLTVSGVNQTLNTTNTAALTINDGTAGDGDTLTVNGTSVSDTIDVARGATTTVAVNSLKTISLTSADVESLVVSAGTGDDTIDVTGSGGPASLTVDGGLPTASDTLAVTTTTATVTYGTDPSSGTLTTTGGPISFVGIEIISLTGDTTGTLTVNGTNGNDAINQSGNTITVNNGAVVDFTAYPTLTLNGLSGDDQFNVAPLTLTGVTTYNVAGDDPTDGDSLIVNGSAGTNAVTITPSAVDAGSVAIGGAPTVSFTTTESVEYNGLGGDDTVTVDTPAGSTTTYTPGATPDSASLQVGSLVPISFTNLGVAGTPQPVTITASAGAGSTLVYQGTENNDTFAVSAVAGPLGQIVLNNQLPVQTNANITTLTLNALDGDDTMKVTGSTAPALPYTAINLNGGDPSASDVVDLSGATGLVTVNLADSTLNPPAAGSNTQITGYGPTITLTGVEVANLDANSHGLTVNGTAQPDSITYTPTGASAGTVTNAGLNTTFNFSTVTGTFTIDPGAGGDTLTVNGTQNSDTITVNSTSVAVSGGLKTVNYNGPDTEFLQIYALAGNDTIDVTPSTTTSIYVDGGDPIGTTPGDQIVLHPTGAFTVEPGPLSDEGGLVNPPNQRVSWVHIEGISFGPGPGPGGAGPPLILGTNGNDDITVIARDSVSTPQYPGADGIQDFTVSVNDGPDMLFINQPYLFIDAMAGNDDIVVREPAPNNAVWDVQVYVAGGTPSTATVDGGDVLELDTQGTTQDVDYTPMPSSIAAPAGVTIPTPGVDTATFNDTTDTSVIAATQFTIGAPFGFNYVSSPDGIEQAVYHGGGGSAGTSDTLTVTGTSGPDVFDFTAGTTVDSGSVVVDSLVPLAFQNIGTSGIVAMADGGGTDTLVYNGSDGNDLFSVAAATGAISLTNDAGAHVVVTVPTTGNLIENLVLNGLDGDDTFDVTGAQLYTTITLNGGDPSASDVANLTGNGTAVTYTTGETQTATGGGLGTVDLTGVEIVNLAAGAGAVTFQGTAGPDAINVTPTVANTAAVTVAGVNQVLNTTSTAASPLTIDPMAGADTVTVNGTSGNDTIATALGAATSSVTVNGFKVSLKATTTESLIVAAGDGTDAMTLTNTVVGVQPDLVSLLFQGGNGDDSLTINVAGSDLIHGPLITYDGGTGSNGLTVTGTPTPAMVSDTYTPGPGTGQGRLAYNNGSLMNIAFLNLAPVVDLVPSPTLIVNGTPADNAINYTQGTVAPTDGKVTVDNFESMEFSNKVNLSINGLAGSDTINLNDPSVPTALTSINVDGGDPTAGSDTLIVNGTTAADTVLIAPTVPGAGLVAFTGSETLTIGFTAIESLLYNGQGGGDALTVESPAGVQTVTYTPGSATDSASLQIGGDVPVSFSNLGAGSVALTDISGARTDNLVYNGTDASDTFSVAAGTGAITLNSQLTVTTPGISQLTLEGYAGDDTFNVAATQPYALITLDGGDPSASDVANLTTTSAADVVKLDLLAQTVTGLGSPIDLTGVETVNFLSGGGAAADAFSVLNLSAASGIHAVNVSANPAAADTLTVAGTVNDDQLTYTPTGAESGNIVDAGNVTLVSFNTLGGAFTVSGGPSGGSDVADLLTVNGTSGSDFITVDSPNRTVTVANAAGTNLKPAILGPTLEEVTVDGGLGQDSFLVIPALATATGPGGAGVGVMVPINLLINVVGGPTDTGDALVVAQAGGAALASTDFVVVNHSTTPDTGVVRIYRSIAGSPVQLPDITYSNIATVSPILPPVVTPTQDPNLLIMGPDEYEQNNYLSSATFLGSGSTINVSNLTIFPNGNEYRFAPADTDWYRVVAQQTGTLDFQVYFRTFSSAMLPGGGDLDIQVYDANGAPAGGITGFGVNGTDANDRRRIPVVAGQTYYLQVYGATSQVINGYNMTIINTPPPVPENLEISDAIAGNVTVDTITSATNDSTFTGTGGDLSSVDSFYNGKYIYFTSGSLAGQRGLISGYVGATKTFTVAAPFATLASVGSTFEIESDDTGTSQLDNDTRDDTPTIYLRVDDAIFLNDLPGNDITDNPPDQVIPIPFSPNGTTPGFRVAVFDEGDTPPQVGVTPPQTPLGFATPVPGAPGVYAFVTPPLVDGSHFLTAEVQMVDPSTPTETGFGGRSLALEIVVDTHAPQVFFGSPTVVNDGLSPSSDSGVGGQPTTNTDRITNVTQPTFFGTAEANSVVRLYADTNDNGQVDATDVYLGETTAIPLDGTNQTPNGQWSLTSTVDLNNPAYFPQDGIRHILATAEDAAGNVSSVAELDIFIDTQGPQISNVAITGSPNYDLFATKGPNSPTSPTPLTYSLTISFIDNPVRVGPNFVYPAVNPALAQTVGNYSVVGEANGPATIVSAVLDDTTVSGGIGMSTVTLTFAKPLPDDRYTITVSDTIADNAGNALDGEFGPAFPTGNGTPGGTFVRQFTIDSRPEIGDYSSAQVFIDANGNFIYDPQNVDQTNRDLTFTMGVAPSIAAMYSPMGIHDTVFSGNFFDPVTGTADGFDKLAAYGFDTLSNNYRWLINTSNTQTIDPADGDFAGIQPAVAGFDINALPVAGNFDGKAADGDQVGLFSDGNWALDTDRNNIIDSGDTFVHSQLQGAPIVGDFNGDGITDLATWKDGVFYFNFGTQPGGPGTPVHWSGNIDATINFDFPGNGEVPVAADMDQDGITDIGLWVPGGQSNQPSESGEFYFLLSNDVPLTLGGAPPKPHSIALLDHPFSPTPIGGDIYAQWGNEYATPLVGNYDPPSVTAAAPTISPDDLGLIESPKVLQGETVTSDTWYSFEPLRDGTASINAGLNSSLGHVQLDLYDSQQDLLATGTTDANGNMALSEPVNAGQTYLVRLSGDNPSVSLTITNQIPASVAYDVNGDGAITPLDALIVINDLNSQGTHALTNLQGAGNQVNLDTNSDGVISPLDALVVINWLNANAGSNASSAVTNSARVAAALSTDDSVSSLLTAGVSAGGVTASLDTSSDSTPSIVAAPLASTTVSTPATKVVRQQLTPGAVDAVAAMIDEFNS
jgi:hypothetical protein